MRTYFWIIALMILVSGCISPFGASSAGTGVSTSLFSFSPASMKSNQLTKLSLSIENRGDYDIEADEGYVYLFGLPNDWTVSDKSNMDSFSGTFGLMGIQNRGGKIFQGEKKDFQWVLRAPQNLPKDEVFSFNAQARICYPYKTKVWGRLEVISEDAWLQDQPKESRIVVEQTKGPIKVEFLSSQPLVVESDVKIKVRITNAGDGTVTINPCAIFETGGSDEEADNLNRLGDIEFGGASCSLEDNELYLQKGQFKEIDIVCSPPSLDDTPTKTEDFTMEISYNYYSDAKASVSVTGTSEAGAGGGGPYETFGCASNAKCYCYNKESLSLDEQGLICGSGSSSSGGSAVASGGASGSTGGGGQTGSGGDTTQTTSTSGALAIELPSTVLQFTSMPIKVTLNGAPVSGAKITVDSKDLGITDAAGSLNYKFDSSGKHTIGASKQSYTTITKEITVLIPYAEFTAQDITITPLSPIINQNIIIKSNIKNIGTKSSTFPVDILVDDKTAGTQSVNLASNEVKEIIFTIKLDKAQSYTISLLGQSKTVTVNAPATTPAATLPIINNKDCVLKDKPWLGWLLGNCGSGKTECTNAECVPTEDKVCCKPVVSSTTSTPSTGSQNLPAPKSTAKCIAGQTEKTEEFNMPLWIYPFTLSGKSYKIEFLGNIYPNTMQGSSLRVKEGDNVRIQATSDLFKISDIQKGADWTSVTLKSLSSTSDSVFSGNNYLEIKFDGTNVLVKSLGGLSACN